MTRGELWWADFGIPFGSEPGFRRPVLVVQHDAFTRSKLQTVLVVPLTSNSALAAAPGNILLKRKQSGLSKESVVNVTQLAVLDKARLVDKVRRLDAETMRAVDDGLRLVLGLHAGAG